MTYSTLPAPAPRRYLVFESSAKPRKLKGRPIGQILEALGVREAAEQAAELLLDRAHVKQVAVLLDPKGRERGVFIAHGRVGWKRYEKNEKVFQVRFLVEEEKET